VLFTWPARRARAATGEGVDEEGSDERRVTRKQDV
jgi:hypothetical protein